jgi:hypothetical protein
MQLRKSVVNSWNVYSLHSEGSEEKYMNLYVQTERERKTAGVLMQTTASEW